MRRITYRIIAIMAAALLALATSGCVDPLDDSLKPQPEEPTLTFWIRVPGSMVTTKAAVGDVASISSESKIYDVQVWAFAHGAVDTDLPLNYVDKDNISFESTTPPTPENYWRDSYKIQMPIPKEFVLEYTEADENDKGPYVDLYILANWKSIFTTKPSQMTLAKVRDMVFSASTEQNPTPDYFGTTTPTIEVPSTGLPISAVYMGTEKDSNNKLKGVGLKFLRDAYNGTGDPLTNDLFKEKLGVIELERAIAKVRFAFARPTGMKGVEITKIEIGPLKTVTVDEKEITVIDTDAAGLIPQQTYVFPHYDDDGKISLPDGYNGATVATIGSGSDPLYKVLANPTTDNPQDPDKDIAQVLDPAKLRSDSDKNIVEGQTAPASMTAQAYDTYLSTYATSTIVYLRESGKKISGLIHYKVDDEEKTRPFEMTVLEEDYKKYNNFYRNHYWTVYAYFQGGDLFVNPTIADWIDAAALSYSLKMNTNMRLFDSWLYRYDTDGDVTPDNYTNWATSHMAVSEGRAEATPAEPVAGRPLRSPQIELVTTGVADASVAGSGSFLLVIDNDDFEILRANKNDIGVVTSYEASSNGILTISAGDDVYTYFYIVPKVGVVPINPIAKVSLIYNDPVTGPQKVTYNYSSLPGYSDDSSEIWVYYFPADQYNITGKLKMYFQDYNNPLVPTPVQN